MPEEKKKSRLELAVDMLGLINEGLPSAMKLILSLRGPNGEEIILNEAEGRSQANIARGEAWLEAHQA